MYKRQTQGISQNVQEDIRFSLELNALESNAALEIKFILPGKFRGFFQTLWPMAAPAGDFRCCLLYTSRIPIEADNPAIQRHEDLCIKCGQCRQVCEREIGVGRLYDLVSTKDTAICIHCGQCANVCPVNSITEVYEYGEVKEAIKDPDKIVIFSTSPSVRVGLGEAFGMAPGSFVEGKMVAALRALGADYVLDTNFSADLTIMEEASELVERITEKKKPLPQFTSCCPAWVKFAETFYPERCV